VKKFERGIEGGNQEIRTKLSRCELEEEEKRVSRRERKGRRRERGVTKKTRSRRLLPPPPGILSLSAFSTAKTEELKEKWNNGALSFSLSNEK